MNWYSVIIPLVPSSPKLNHSFQAARLARILRASRGPRASVTNAHTNARRKAKSARDRNALPPRRRSPSGIGVRR